MTTKQLITLTTIISFAVLLQNYALADDSREYLAQSQKVSSLEYEAFITANSQFKPISEKWLQERTYEVSAQTLRSLFDEAEKSFLSEPVEVAHDKYKQVSAVALKSDWSDSERKLLFHAFLRTAQTAINEKRRLQYLIQAKQFDSHLKPDENLFPPPLIKEWSAIQNKEAFQIVQLDKSFSSYKTGFINGQKTEFKRFVVQVPRGSFRLTLISNSKAPLTKILDGDDVKSFRPSSSWLAQGDCKQPALTKNIKNNAAALYEKDCVARDGTKNLSNNQHQLLAQRNQYTSDNALAEARLQTRTEFNSQPFYQSGYFWAAAGAVAAYIIYKDQQKEEREPQTHKTGL